MNHRLNRFVVIVGSLSLIVLLVVMVLLYRSICPPNSKLGFVFVALVPFFLLSLNWCVTCSYHCGKEPTTEVGRVLTDAFTKKIWKLYPTVVFVLTSYALLLYAIGSSNFASLTPFCLASSAFYLLIFIFLLAALPHHIICRYIEDINTKGKEAEIEAEDKHAEDEHEHEYLLDMIWVWLLSIGLYAVFVDYFFNVFKVPLPPANAFYYFIIDLLKEKSDDVFSIFLMAILAEFIIQFLLSYRVLYRKTKDSSEKLKSLNEETTTLSEQIEKVNEELPNNISQLQEARKAVTAETKELREIAARQQNWVRLLEIDSGLGDHYSIVSNCVGTSMERLTDNMLEALSHYSAEGDKPTLVHDKDNQHWLFAEKKVATTFVEEFLELFAMSKGSRNYVQANFAIMSNIVDKMYGLCNEIYEEYISSDTKRNENLYQYRIVYFTTLTMPPLNYFDPRESPSRFSVSALEAWNTYRKKTRRWGYEKDDGTIEPGHIGIFAENPRKFRFYRCHLYVPDTEGSNGIVSEKDLRDQRKYHVIVRVKSEGETTYHEDITEPQDIKMLEGKGIKYYLPDLREEAVVSKESREKERLDYVSIEKAFKELYHTKETDYYDYPLSLDALKGFIEDCKNKLNKDDKSSCDRLLKKMEEIKSEETKKKEQLKLFFSDGYFPLDVFAIGIGEVDSTLNIIKKVEWLTCLSGYIGGDFNRMTLGWQDALISSNGEESCSWSLLKEYLNFVFSKRNT